MTVGEPPEQASDLRRYMNWQVSRLLTAPGQSVALSFRGRVHSAAENSSSIRVSRRQELARGALDPPVAELDSLRGHGRSAGPV